MFVHLLSLEVVSSRMSISSRESFVFHVGKNVFNFKKFLEKLIIFTLWYSCVGLYTYVYNEAFDIEHQKLLVF